MEAANPMTHDGLMVAIFFILIGVVAFFMKGMSKKVEKIDDISTEWKLMANDMKSISETLKEAKPKLESITFMEKRIDAAFKIIDKQAETIQALRERSHELANWCQSLRNKYESHGDKFLGSWTLPPIDKKGE